MTESNRIEYKRELTESLEKEVIAFLNYKDGGVIYLGIDKNGAIHGVPEAECHTLRALCVQIGPSCRFVMIEGGACAMTG